jgi:hypothetical protein
VPTGKMEKRTDMKATLNFPTREQAEQFALDWGRYSKTGHIVGAGETDVEVTVFDLTDEDKKWVDNYVANMNKHIEIAPENRSDKMNYDSELTVLSFGGGQDSTAILYKLVYDEHWKQKYWVGKLIVVMANTGNEHPETYEHVDKVWSFCVDHGIEFYMLGFEYTPESYKGGLIYHYEKNVNVGSKAFPKTCTANLKITPIYEFINEYIGLTFLSDSKPYYAPKLMKRKQRWSVVTRGGSQATSKAWGERDFATKEEAQEKANELILSGAGGKYHIKELTDRTGKINMIIGIALGEEGRVSADNGNWNEWQGRIAKIYPLLEENPTGIASGKSLESITEKIAGYYAVPVKSILLERKEADKDLDNDWEGWEVFEVTQQDQLKKNGLRVVPNGKDYVFETYKIDREGCQKYIASTGHEVPIPSACILCPFMNDQELLYLYRFQRDWYERWVQIERDKIVNSAYKGDLTKTRNSEGDIVENLGVWGGAGQLLPEILIEVQEKYGHMTDKEVREYRFSHGHCVKNKM